MNLTAAESLMAYTTLYLCEYNEGKRSFSDFARRCTEVAESKLYSLSQAVCSVMTTELTVMFREMVHDSVFVVDGIEYDVNSDVWARAVSSIVSKPIIREIVEIKINEHRKLRDSTIRGSIHNAFKDVALMLIAVFSANNYSSEAETKASLMRLLDQWAADCESVISDSVIRYHRGKP